MTGRTNAISPAGGGGTELVTGILHGTSDWLPSNAVVLWANDEEVKTITLLKNQEETIQCTKNSFLLFTRVIPSSSTGGIQVTQPEGITYAYGYITGDFEVSY